MSQTTNLGKVCVTPKGTHNPAITYAILDIVTDNGSSYIAIKDVPVNIAITNTSYWQLIAAKGGAGEITDVTASISGGYGTPGVTVTEGGTTTEKTLAFAFENLVGNGVSSITSEKTGTSGNVDTYTMTITYDSGDTDTVTYTVTNGSVTSVDGKTGDVDLSEKYAQIDDLKEGNLVPAKALLADNFDSKMVINDKSAYNFRPTATMGSMELEVGTPCKVKSIIGGSLGWNQLIRKSALPSTQTVNGITLTNNGDGSITLDGTSTDRATFSMGETIILTKGHQMFVTGLDNLSVHGGGWSFASSADAIVTISGETGGDVILFDVLAAGITFSNQKFYPMLIDLTACFGSAIADYIYSLEQATAGAGVAWFKRYFPKPYYEYKAIGDFTNVMTKGKKYVGFNQCNRNACVEDKGLTYSDGTLFIDDKSVVTDFIEAVDATYYTNYETICYGYDADKNYIGCYNPNDNQWVKDSVSSSHLFNITGAYYIRFWFRSSFNSGIDMRMADLNLNFHYDGERDGEYEAYKSWTEDVDPIELIGIPKVDANGNLYYDGNVYNADGSVDENWEVFDFPSDKSVTKNDESDPDDWLYFFSILNGAKTGKDVFCNKLATLESGGAPIGQQGGQCSINATYNVIYVNLYGLINENTTSAVKNWLLDNDAKFIIPKATPTTSSATPFAEAQETDNWGTEEWLAPDDDTRPVDVPVGHDTDYLPDYKAKTEVAADMPGDDGNYILNHDETNAGNPNVYTPIGTWLSANGYYKLQDLLSVFAVKENAGGILRHMLVNQVVAGGGTLDFADTAWLDLGDLNWTYDSTNDFFAVLYNEREAGVDFISSLYKNIGAKTDEEMLSADNMSIASNSISGKWLNIKNTSYTDATAFKNAMKGILIAVVKA